MKQFEMPPPDAEPESRVVQESPDLFDYGQIKDYARFVLRAARRHKLIFASIFALVMAFSAAYVWALPRIYHVETKLLGQRNQVISSLAVPSRAMPGEADAPARAAADLIKSRDSLLTLMEQTDLVNHFYQHRSPGGAIKDWILRRVAKPSEEDKREGILGLLDQRLTVYGSGYWEGTVTIAVDWPDPKMALLLVNQAQRNFIDARHGTELSNINEAISILEQYADQYRKDVEVAADELKALRAQKPTRARSAAPTRRPRRPVLNPELTDLRSTIEGKRRAIRELEEIQRRRVNELQARLDEETRTYADGHPIVMESRQLLRAAMVDSPQLAQLRRDLVDFQADYARRGGLNDDTFVAAPLSPDVVQLQIEADDADSGEEFLKKHQLAQALGKYSALLSRIDSAKIELDTARASFKYRYSVLREATRPYKPISPRAASIFVASGIAGLLLALFAVVAIDIRSGEILELWQVERKLRLPVLAELP